MAKLRLEGQKEEADLLKSRTTVELEAHQNDGQEPGGGEVSADDLAQSRERGTPFFQGSNLRSVVTLVKPSYRLANMQPAKDSPTAEQQHTGKKLI